METNDIKLEHAMQRFGERCRDGYARQNPPSIRSMDTFKDAVRAEWEREQEMDKDKQMELNPPNMVRERNLENHELEP